MALSRRLAFNNFQEEGGITPLHEIYLSVSGLPSFTSQPSFVGRRRKGAVCLHDCLCVDLPLPHSGRRLHSSYECLAHTSPICQLFPLPLPLFQRTPSMPSLEMPILSCHLLGCHTWEASRLL